MEAITVNEGIAIGNVYKLETLNFKIPKKIIEDINTEITNYNNSLEKAKKDISNLKDIAFKKLGQDYAFIFESHLLVLEDPLLSSQVEEMITKEKISSEYALLKVRNALVTTFKTMENNDYMKERSIDILDSTNRILAYLTNQTYPDLLSIKEDTILICEELTPSDTVQLNEYVKGVITNVGGRTSHSSIMLRSLEIPSIITSKTNTKKIKNKDYLILDCINNEIKINPTNDEIDLYKQEILKLIELKEITLKYKNEKTITIDNFETKLNANIESIEDLEKVITSGSEGIGLFRTEFIYFNKTKLPTEEEQYSIYKKVLETMKDSFVTIRTLDIGGDKELSYLPIKKEMNPFLGYRAIRLTLDKKDIFKTQLRALLRASVHGNLKIMFPMISTIEEFKQSKEILFEVHNELIKENIQVNKYEIGMMVEVPSAVMLADKFAKYVDFFSIGTNDLIQYTFAADRLNDKVSYLYQPLNPSLLRMIKYVIDCANKEGKTTSLCGEVSSDKDVIPLLIGMGLDEFSMNTSSILLTRYQISKLNKNELENLVEKALNCETSEEVYNLVKSR